MSQAMEHLISINIHGRYYQVQCPDEEKEALQEAAQVLEAEMRQVEKGGAWPVDQLAIVAGLNICRELNLLRAKRSDSIDVVNQKIKNLQDRIENFLEMNDTVPV